MTMTEAASESAVTSPTSEIEVKIGGATYGGTSDVPVVHALVETSLRMPAMAVVAFSDDGDHSKAKSLQLDDLVEISFGGVGQTGDDKPIAFKGKVAAIEAHRDALLGRTVVRCFDAVADLYGARRTKTFLKVTYGDIVNQIVTGAKGTVESGGPVHDYVIQYEESDGEFIERLAADAGFVFFMDETWKFNFCRPPDLSGGPATPSFSSGGTRQLVFGDDLVNYEVSYGPKPRFDKVKVFGWDIHQGQEIETQAPLSAGRKFAELTHLPTTFEAGEFLVSTIPARSQQIAEATAAGVADQIVAGVVTLRGRVRTGNPYVSAGQVVSLGPGDHSFAGTYMISSARHVYDGGRLSTEVVCDGLGDRGITGVGTNAPPAAAPPATVPWVTVGIVENVQDHGDEGTENMGRVRVKLAGLGLGDGTSDWLRVVAPGNGKDRGTWWLPDVGDEVLVVFERGDMRTGYVLGGLHNGQKLPLLGPEATGGGTVKQRGWISGAGHRLLFTEHPTDEAAIDLISGDSRFKLNFAQKDTVLTIDVDGEMTIKLDKAEGISITSNKKIAIESKEGDIEMKAMNVKIEATSDVSVKGVNVKAEASAGFEAKGATAKVVGQGQAELSSGGVTAVKGSMVQIN